SGVGEHSAARGVFPAHDYPRSPAQAESHSMTSTARKAGAEPLLTRFRERAGGSPWRALCIFLGPALAFYVLLTAYPVLLTFYNSLHTIQPNQQSTFVGFSNYVSLLTTDRVFRTAAINTFIWSTVAPVVDVV